MNVILFIKPDGTVRFIWTTRTTLDGPGHGPEPGEVALLLAPLDSKARHNHEV